MKTSLLIICGCLMAGAVFGDVNMSIAIGQAKRVANANPNGAQTGGQPQPPQPPPMNPELAATLQNIADLRADFVAISSAADAAAAADQKVPLLNHLAAAANGSKASSANLRKLADDLIAAMSGHKLDSDNALKLARTVHAMFNGAHITTTQQETLLKNANTAFTTAAVPDEAAAAVVDDLKTIAAETK